MANKKIDYNSISFKNKDVDKFLTKFGNDNKDPLKKGDITSVRESTNVNTPNMKAIITKDTPISGGPTDQDWKVRENIFEAYKKNPSPENKKKVINNNAYMQSKVQAEKEMRKELMKKGK